MLLSKLGELISEYQPACTVLVIIGFVAVTYMCGINPDKLKCILERSTHEVCGNSSRADVPPADFPSFTHIKHVAAPASKSYLHREIIAASLAGHELQLDITDLSDDILATYEAMVKLPNQPPRKNNVINRNAGTPERFDTPSPDSNTELKALVDKYSSEDWRYGRKIPFTTSITERLDWGGIDIELQVEGGFIKDCGLYSDSLETAVFDELRDKLLGCKYNKAAMSTLVEGMLPYAPASKEYQICSDITDLIADGIM